MKIDAHEMEILDTSGHTRTTWVCGQAREKVIHMCAKSGRRYRIRSHTLVGNVEQLDGGGNVIARLCAHDRHIGLPMSDQLLAQMFWLRHHEDEFLRIANRH